VGPTFRPAFDGQAAVAKSRSVDIPASDIVRYLSGQPGVAGVSDVRDLLVPGGAGASNGILFFTADVDSGNGARALELVLRYETDTPLLKQKRFQDEYETIRAVNQVGLPAPRARWEDVEGRFLGRPSYITERLRGACPPSSIYADGVLMDAEPSRRKLMMLSVAEYHGKLHAANIGPAASRI
jgi:aminoglycoside phosphotransferase (APT) family kinase protein